MQYRVEQAQEADIAAIQAVADVSWRATYTDIFAPDFIDRWLQDAYSTDALHRDIARENSQFLVAKVGEQIVGYGQAGVGWSGQGFALYRLYVDPSYWRQGIGARLLAAIEAWLKAQGATGYSCFVHSQNEVGKAFYQKSGFVHQPVHDHAHEWCMEKPLPA